MPTATEDREILRYAWGPVIAAVPPESQFLWNRAVKAMRELDTFELRFPCVRRQRDEQRERDRLARMISVRPEDLDAMDELLDVGALEVDGDGVLFCPLLRKQEERRLARAEERERIREMMAEAAARGEPISARVAASQSNGKFGGRPRKDGTPARSYYAQREMPLLRTVQGSPAAVQSSPEAAQDRNPETREGAGFSNPDPALDEKPSAGLPEDSLTVTTEFKPAGRPAISTPVEEESARDAKAHGGAESGNPGSGFEANAAPAAEVSDEAVDALGRKACVKAGLDRSSWGANLRSTVRGWTAIATEAEILEVIGRLSSREKADIRSLRYFTSAIAEYRQKRALETTLTTSEASVESAAGERSPWERVLTSVRTADVRCWTWLKDATLEIDGNAATVWAATPLGRSMLLDNHRQLIERIIRSECGSALALRVRSRETDEERKRKSG